MLEFWVTGRPQQRGSKKPFRVGDRIAMTDDNKKSGPWMSTVAHAANVAYRGNSLMAGPLQLECQFYFQRPQSHYGTGRNAKKLKPSAPQYHAQTPDVSKLVRSIEDAMTGVVYRDDKQIVILQAERNWTESTEGVQVTVSEL